MYYFLFKTDFPPIFILFVYERAVFLSLRLKYSRLSLIASYHPHLICHHVLLNLAAKSFPWKIFHQFTIHSSYQSVCKTFSTFMSILYTKNVLFCRGNITTSLTENFQKIIREFYEDFVC